MMTPTRQLPAFATQRPCAEGLGRGFNIFPLRGKMPFAGTHGFKDATDNLEVIEAWMKEYPNCNWGIATGAANELVVLDVDPRNGGDDSLADLEKKYGALPETFSVKTGGGGQHFYFSHPGGKIKSGANVLGAGLDVKGDGGYVVAPDSIHPDTKRQYVVDSDTDIAEIPAWLLTQLREKPAAAQAHGDNGQKGINEGERNNTLASMAGAMQRRGISAGTILIALKEENRKRCNPPLPDAELESIATSIGNYQPAGKAYHRTELGNAERVYDMFRDNIRFCKELGGWMCWSRKLWKRDATKQICRLYKKMLKEIHAEAATLQDSAEREKLGGWAYKSERKALMRDSLEWLESFEGITVGREVFDQGRHLLNLRNGTFNLDTGTLGSHNRGDMITRIIDIDYDATAKAPTWDAFLKRVVPGKDLRDYLQRAVGYSLSGSPVERVYFILCGRGRNGKSTFVETISRVLAEFAVKTPMSTFMETSNTQTYDLAALVPARLVTAAEAKATQKADSGKIKEMVGCDTLSYRQIYGKQKTFLPEFTIWISTNHLPMMTDSTDSAWDRPKMIPFNERITTAEMNKDLGKKLQAEMPGILKWALDGHGFWRRFGLKEPQVVTDAIANYRRICDPLGDFADRLKFAPNVWIETGALWDAYLSWAEENRINRPMGRRTLTGILADHGATAEKKYDGPKQLRIWRGVELI
jgi:putative DNA primase/helicase